MDAEQWRKIYDNYEDSSEKAGYPYIGLFNATLRRHANADRPFWVSPEGRVHEGERQQLHLEMIGDVEELRALREDHTISYKELFSLGWVRVGWEGGPRSALYGEGPSLNAIRRAFGLLPVELLFVHDVSVETPEGYIVSTVGPGEDALEALNTTMVRKADATCPYCSHEMVILEQPDRIMCPYCRRQLAVSDPKEQRAIQAQPNPEMESVSRPNLPMDQPGHNDSYDWRQYPTANGPLYGA
jgi:hypothetical protein